MKVTLGHIAALRASYHIGINRYFELLDKSESTYNKNELEKQAERNRKLDEQIHKSLEQYASEIISDNKPKAASWVGGQPTLLQEEQKENIEF